MEHEDWRENLWSELFNLRKLLKNKIKENIFVTPLWARAEKLSQNFENLDNKAIENEIQDIQGSDVLKDA